MIARVTLEIALRKDFDYAIPPELAGRIEVGSRVKVPFGPRQVMGVVTSLIEESTHTNLRAITKIIGQQSAVTPKVLQLARWIGDYYCCPIEIALKSVLPDAVRKEESGWRERLFVRVVPRSGELPKLTKRQEDVWNVIEEWRELPLQELLRLTGTTAETARKLEDKGLVSISPQVSERDPYAHEHILPTQPILMNPEQAAALAKIIAAMDQRAAGILPTGSASSTSALGNSATGSSVTPFRRQDAGDTLSGVSPFFSKDASIQKYSGWLPHWRQSEKLYFVTFRLADSISQSDQKAWTEEKRIWESHHPKPLDERAWAEYHERFTERMEKMLDAGHGSCALAKPEVRSIVEDALKHFDGERYRLGDHVVMPNHVHVLVQPAVEHDLSGIMHSWKSFTAKKANALLQTTGSFWRDEYFDHLVRSAAQLEKYRSYIHENPVKARLKSGSFCVGKGLFQFEPSRGSDVNCRQDAGGTLVRAAGVSPADSVSSTSALGSSVTGSSIAPSRRQDAGGTLERAVGISPADSVSSTPALGSSVTGSSIAPSRRQDAGGTLERAAGVSPADSVSSTSALGNSVTGSSIAPFRRQDAGGTFLLHGVTGSGKTEVYLQAIAHTLEQGKGAIVLVPEISLTPQTVERFKARFSSGKLQTLVAVLHSHLSTGERHDEWHKIRQGRARIVIGARSAIFAPVDPLGLIIVDEEHEHSYKQEESPRYHARDVAVVRGQMEGAVVVLGSATPSMESFYNASRGKYTLLEMKLRVDNQKMPIVRVVDMRQENRKNKGAQIFSEQLKEAITQRLEKKEQVILFLNRRGWSTSLQCPSCGYVAECPNCSVSLTYHRAAQKLLCHICGHETKAPKVCPELKCANPAIRYSGLGTERVEDTLTKLFPQASIKRMDSDVLKRKDDFRRILGDFRTGKIDILVGTQMIAKGLHFPNVTLVGIIYADLSLHIPDFRAGERTFQLLTQVAGRAGRGDVEGEVFVQAFTPFHPAIQYARRHDFIGFYDQEIAFRDQLKYPPAGRIALLVLKGRNEEKVKFSAEHVRAELEKRGKTGDESEQVGKRESGTEELALGVVRKTDSHLPTLPPAHLPKDLVIAGPAPAPLARAESFYRYQIMLRTRQMSALSRHLAALIESLELPDDVTLTVDIDPVNLS